MLKQRFIKFGLIILIPSLFFCGNCNKCKEVFELADLLVDHVEQFTTFENNEKVYHVVHTVLNSAEGIACKDEVETAGGHDDKIPIEYSQDGNFDSNGSEIGSKSFKADPTNSQDAYEINSDIVFAVNGVYRIIANIDINNVVQERNENNNVSTNGITGKQEFTKGTNIYIHVTDAGRDTPEIDANGNPIYIKRWDIKTD